MCENGPAAAPMRGAVWLLNTPLCRPAHSAMYSRLPSGSFSSWRCPARENRRSGLLDAPAAIVLAAMFCGTYSGLVDRMNRDCALMPFCHVRSAVLPGLACASSSSATFLVTIAHRLLGAKFAACPVVVCVATGGA